MWQDITLSQDQTYHIRHNCPLYNQRFIKVGKFHSPGLAPVEGTDGAYHICVDGSPAYNHRYLKSFGFYDQKAAVVTPNGGCHIGAHGEPLYPERYIWCGNFQEGACVVRNNLGFFHINEAGYPLYEGHYAYAGDFKDGFAVVTLNVSKSTHINIRGDYVHNQWFDALDVFHKGWARAKDNKGWFHVDNQGQEAYNHRFHCVEPFYNGMAYCQQHDNTWVIIDEKGIIKHRLGESNIEGNMLHLASSLVGFWQSHALMAFFMLKVPQHLPCTLELLTKKMGIPQKNLYRLLKALGEIGVVQEKDKIWEMTIFCEDNDYDLLTAMSHLWQEVSRLWYDIPSKLEANYEPKSIFKIKEPCKEKAYHYHQALLGYALKDFDKTVTNFIEWPNYKRVLGLGRAALPLLMHGQKKGLPVTLYEIPWYQEPLRDHSSMDIKLFDLQESWPDACFDLILLPRFLMHYDDTIALKMLSHAKKHLDQGHMIIIEPLPNSTDYDLALLDLNIWLESRGKLRDDKQWRTLLGQVGLNILYTKNFNKILSAMAIQ